jgi:HEAT repeat protein
MMIRRTFFDRHFLRLSLGTCISIISIGTPTWAQDSLLQDKSIDELIGVLNDAAFQSGDPTFTKAMACRQLSIRGDVAAVPALKKLLGDAELSTYARTALESISGPEATLALREATSDLDGELLIGVVGSLGNLRDTDSIPLLADYLKHPNRDIAAAAARALGSIGTPTAASPLHERLASDSTGENQDLGWALVHCAMRCASESQPQMAVTFLEAVLEQEVSNQVKNAARQQIIPLKGQQGLAALRELLVSEDRSEFSTGLQISRSMGPSAAEVLISVYPKLTPDRKILCLHVLESNAASGDLLALLKEAVKDNHPGIRSQAYRNLGQHSAESALPLLIRGLGAPEPEVAKAAAEALVVLPGKEVEPAVMSILEDSDDSRLGLAVEIAAQRQLASAPPALFMILDGKNTEVADAAMVALGSTITLRELPRILERAQDRSDPRRDAALRALSVACARLPREDCAEMISEAIRASGSDEKVALMDQLALLGGVRALETVSAAAESNDDLLKDNATRLLGAWPTSDVAPVLATLASEMPEGKYKIRVLRGYIRVARQLDLPVQGRIAVCRRALELAQRPEDKQLVLDVLKRYPTPSGIIVAGELLNDPALSNQAISTASQIAQSQLSSEPWAVKSALGLIQEELPETRRAAFRDLLTSAQAAVDEKEAEDGFEPIFDGKTFAGWHGNKDIFRIADGQIVGGNLKDRVERNEFLRTDKQYENFELRLQFKLLGESPNAGVQIRTQEIPDHHEVSGYQADLGPGWWGCLYDESRRNRVLAGPPSEERGNPVRVNDWNDYRILCEGKRIRLWINGVPTVDFTESDDSIPLKGVIAVQVHSGAPMEARYRNLRIRSLDK